MADEEVVYRDEVFGGAEEPNGNVEAEGPAVYIQDNGKIWVKPAGSTGTTGWI